MQFTTIFTGITAIAAMAATAYGAAPVNDQPAVPNNVTADKFDFKLDFHRFQDANCGVEINKGRTITAGKCVDFHHDDPKFLSWEFTTANHNPPSHGQMCFSTFYTNTDCEGDTFKPRSEFSSRSSLLQYTDAALQIRTWSPRLV
jgi:hypothetical protein